MPVRYPTRFIPDPRVRGRFHGRLDRLASFLWAGDPLADDAVEALAGMEVAARGALVERGLTHGADAVPDAAPAVRAFFAELWRVPLWFDRERANRGGEVFLRAGIVGGLVLGLRSLVGGYCSPAGNKPLMFSNRLRDDVPRRLTDTARYVHATVVRDGLVRGAEGFRAAGKVRLLHAQIRRLLDRSGRWRRDDWGLPLNQYDMLGTQLLFSFSVLDGLRLLGQAITPEEGADFLHLWRYAGHLMGVCGELLPTDERSAADLWDMLQGTQGPPDDDSRALAAALLSHANVGWRSRYERLLAERSIPFAYALSRYLIGDYYADHLGFPRTAWELAMPAVRGMVAAADVVRRRAPRSGGFTARAGAKYWTEAIRASGLEHWAAWSMPERLKSDSVRPPPPDAVRSAEAGFIT